MDEWWIITCQSHWFHVTLIEGIASLYYRRQLTTIPSFVHLSTIQMTAESDKGYEAHVEGY